MEQQQNTQQWSENVIIVNGDYVDSVAFDLIVNFERMIGRRIPPADMGRWIDCVALDGGLRPGQHHTMVAIYHSEGSQGMDNFAPGRYATELSGMAFSDNMGEFALSAHPIIASVGGAHVVADAALAACAASDVRRVMVVPSPEEYHLLRSALSHIDIGDKHITLFAMEPMPTGCYRQEILGYSLMSALGIKAEEIRPQ